MQEEATKKRAFSMLEKRDYSVKELTDRLLEKGEPPEAVYALTARLVELGVLDDARYAGLVTRHYAAKGYGARRIRDELYRRGDRADYRVVIHQGKKRQIRRMCAAVGLTVTRLCRIAEGGLELGALPPGRWRYLTAGELESIKGSD